MDIEYIIATLIKNKIFKKLKSVNENNLWHENETVYDHSIKTMKIAQKEIKGKFITNHKARELYFHFANKHIDGIKRGNIMVLIALLHDIGKALSYKEGGHVLPITTIHPDGTTTSPGHQYYGSTLIPELLAPLGFSQKLIMYVTKVVALHDTFNDGYFTSRKDWNFTLLTADVKAQAEGYYIETLFNIYCDNYYSDVSKESKETIIKLFNKPLLYVPRDYFILEKKNGK